MRRPPESTRSNFNATSGRGNWLFLFRRGGSTIMIQRAALRSRLEKSAEAESAAKLKGSRMGH
jgi:hypothetical protein